ncbi:MAG: HAD-IA family hydrolase [Anaerobutyricum sp.]
MKQYLLFDLDGTLTDPMVGITSSVQYALEKFGIHVRYLKELIPFIGPPLAESFQKFYGFSKEDAEKAIQYYREYYAPKGIFENEVYEGIPEMLAHLTEAGFTLLVATSKPTVFARKVLKHFGMEDYFSFVGGSELDGSRTKKAEVISYILKTCGIEAKEAIMIGDRRHDIEGGKACGLESVGVLYGYGMEQELTEAGANHIIRTVAELEDYLRNQGENPAKLTWYDRLKGRTEEGKETDMIRFGMIGTGKIAEKFWQANRYGKDFELTAVYSRTLERARQFGFQKGQLQYFDDLEAFANSDCIDAVYVASPNCCHYEQVMTLLKAGKHVLCEKPMASNLEQAQEMFAEAEKQNLILLEGMRSIYAPSFQKMIPYMETLGTIRRATLQYCQYSSRYDNYKRGIVENAFKPELSNGALMDIGVYVVSCMIRLFGAPKSIKASGVKLHNGVDGAGTILMEYPDMIGEAIYSKITDSAMPSQIQGEDASMLIQEIENVKDLRIVRKGVVQSIHFEQSDNILNYETQEFIKMIKTGMGWEKSKEITLETMKVLDEARKQLHIVFPADKKPKEKKK